MKKITAFLTILAADFPGTVDTPPGVTGIESGGLGNFINAILKLLIVIAGIYAVFNFVLAGYSFMSAGDDPKKMADAWGRIWKTIIGLIFAAGAFVIAELVSQLVFKGQYSILDPKIFEPQ